MSTHFVARLSGGLGNQLFQYATVLGLARATGGTAALDASSFRDGEDGRAFALGDFDLGASVLDGIAFDPTSPSVIVPFSPDDSPHRLPVHRENNYEFEAATGGLRSSAYLYGFWQSWRYFADIGDELRERLLAGPAWPGKFDQQRAVALHVRRGDYLSAGVQQRFGQCAMPYYEAAMALVRARVPGARFFVFSDDPKWCRNHFAAGDITLVSQPGQNAVQDLRLMAGCRHHIVANSSLSWWGAWLGASAQSTVIAPIPWYNQSPRATDLIPKHWIRLNRRSGKDWAVEQQQIDGRVSVIVLNRAGSARLELALASVRAQTHQNLEIIVCSGSGAATGAAVAKANGDWIAFLDDSDVWFPDMLRIHLEAAHLTGADVVNCRTVARAGNNGVPPLLYPPPGRPDCDLQALLRAGNFVAGISHTLVRRALFAQSEPWPASWSPDKPGEKLARLLQRPTALLLWQRLVESPIPWLAQGP